MTRLVGIILNVVFDRADATLACISDFLPEGIGSALGDWSWRTFYESSLAVWAQNQRYPQ